MSVVGYCHPFLYDPRAFWWFFPSPKLVFLARQAKRSEGPPYSVACVSLVAHVYAGIRVATRLSVVLDVGSLSLLGGRGEKVGGRAKGTSFSLRVLLQMTAGQWIAAGGWRARAQQKRREAREGSKP